MAKSKARKKRDHLLRTRGRDVTILRGSQADFSTHERKTLTKSEKLQRNRTKHKKCYLQNECREDSAFYFAQKKLTPA